MWVITLLWMTAIPLNVSPDGVQRSGEGLAVVRSADHRADHRAAVAVRTDEVAVAAGTSARSGFLGRAALLVAESRLPLVEELT